MLFHANAAILYIAMKTVENTSSERILNMNQSINRFALICLCVLALLFAPAIPAFSESLPAADFALSLSADATSVIAGQKVAISAAFANPETVNQKARNNGILWSVTDEAGAPTKLASVNNNGQLTTQKTLEQTTVFVITAVAKSMPDQSASIRITVTPCAASVAINASRSVVYTNAGFNTLQLSASVEPADAGQQVTWTSSSPKVLSVDENGLVTALAPGRVTITATAEDGSRKSGKINLQVGEAAERIDLSVPVGLLKAGGSMNFGYTFGYELTPQVWEQHPEKIWAKAKPINQDVEWSLVVDKPEAEPYITLKNGKLTVAKDCPVCQVKVTVTALGALPGRNVSSTCVRYVIPALSGNPVDQANLMDFYGVWRIAALMDEAGKRYEPSEKLLQLANLVEDQYWYEVGYYHHSDSQQENSIELCFSSGLVNMSYPVSQDGGALYLRGDPKLTMQDDGTMITDLTIADVPYLALLYPVDEDFHSSLTLRGETKYETDENGNITRATDYYVFGGVMAVTDYTYNDAGKLLEQVTRDANGNETKRFTYEYDSNGYLTAQAQYINGSLDQKEEKQYDDNGLLLREARYSNGDELTGFETHEYDEAGREIKMEQHDKNGFVYLWRSETYNDHGDLIRHLWYGADNQINYSLECMDIEYDYDAAGNITEKRYYYYNPDGTTYLARTEHPNEE